MVWSNTNKVGCGVTEYIDGKWFAKLYTCNYGPAGTQRPRIDLNKRFLPRPNTTTGLISARIKTLHIGNFFTK